MGDSAWSWKVFLKAILPIKGDAYWFATVYIGLYLLHPYLNRMIVGLKKPEAHKLIGILIALFSVYSFAGDVYKVHSGAGVLWFIVLYLIGAYIKLFGMTRKRRYIYIYIVVSAHVCLISSSFKFYSFGKAVIL